MDVENQFERWAESNDSCIYLEKCHNDKLIVGFLDQGDVFLALNFAPGSSRNSITCEVESKFKSLRLLVKDINKQLAKTSRRSLTVPVVLTTVNQIYSDFYSPTAAKQPTDDGLPDEYFVEAAVSSKQTSDGAKEEETKASGDATPTCVICMEDLKNGEMERKLEKCGHEFHAICIGQYFASCKLQCPSCKEFYGEQKGNQPPGTMSTAVIPGTIPGYPGAKGIIQITYSFSGGIQGPEHPNPGQPYYGTSRIAYLPNNAEGQEVNKLLRKAFDNRLTFTIGTSVTTGADDSVVWNGIHHKTSLHGGSTHFGYPDDHYLTRVKEELASVGILGGQ